MSFGRRTSRILLSPLVLRISSILTTLIGISIFVFLVLRVIPGDSIVGAFGIDTGVLTPNQIAELKIYYGIDKSLPMQYLSWMQSFLSGNMGFSYSTGISVASLTAKSLPVTIELALIGTILGVVMGIAIGTFSARKPGSARDFAGQLFGLMALAVPGFVLSTAIVTILANKFHYFPNGYEFLRLWEDPWMNFQQMMFPGLVLGIAVAAPVMRTTRSALLETVDKDFVRTAIGKGVNPRKVQSRHILRNSLIPIVTMTGIQFGYLMPRVQQFPARLPPICSEPVPRH